MKSSRIESAPPAKAAGSYSFSIDADGHIYEARMRDALRVCTVSPRR